MVEEKENSKGEFNQAGFIMMRLHDLFRMNDMLACSPLAIDPATNEYSYKIMFANLVSVYSTVSAKFDEKEKVKVLKIRKLILDTFEFLPIFNTKKEDSFTGAKANRLFINKVNYKSTMDLLFHFRTQLECLMDKHHIGNPSKDGEGEWD